MSRLQLAIQQISQARDYTSRMLDQTRPEDWLRIPPAGVTHIVWQVGHLTMAEYRLALERIRGSQPGDRELISEEFLRQFGRESVPAEDAAKYPDAANLRATFDRVHQQVLRELPGVPESELDEPPTRPHPIGTTKLRSLLWCAQHEAVHSGQIGLLRRQLGYAPLW